MTGWICPQCGRVYSPATAECSPCNRPPITVSRLGCTCGTTVVCPLHGARWVPCTTWTMTETFYEPHD